MAKFTTFANDMIDHEAQNGSSGTFAVGSTTYTLPLKQGLTTTLSTAGALGTEVSGGSYARQSLAGTLATAASGASKTMSSASTFSSMPACTWADVFVADSNATPKNMNFKGTPSLAKTVNAGDTCLSTLTFTEA